MLSKRGFTLIELLVVVGIIGVLASIVLASLSSARAKGRDAKRLADIKQIQLALELYYDANNAFPGGTVINSKNALDPSVLVSAGFISVMPTDPSTGANYLYTAYAATTNNTVCSSYHLGATLETANHIDLSQDADISQNNGGKPPAGYTICVTGSQPSNDFDGLATGANCSGIMGTQVQVGVSGTEMCYDVRP